MRRILNRAVKGKNTPEEALFLEALDRFQEKEAQNFEGISSLDQIEREIWTKINNKRQSKSKAGVLTRFPMLRYAAILATAVCTVTFIFVLQRNQLIPDQDQHGVAIPSDLPPGTNQATLQLPDGRVISLSNEQEGIIIGDQIAYSDGSVLPEIKADEHVNQMILETPQGGMYQITLPDGTHVWLNAGTKLTYPERFNATTRSVELEGEAYFEVAHAAVPFLVKTAQQTVQVLGTSFNISAYKDDSATVTTLVNGKVNVSNHQSGSHLTLSPGQQAVVQGTGVQRKIVDVADFSAWKDGYFVFNDTPLSQILKQLRRWYNFELDHDLIPELHFNGGIRRDVPLSEVLHMLQSTTDAVDFQINGRKLLIRAK